MQGNMLRSRSSPGLGTGIKSVPGLLGLGTTMPKMKGHEKPMTLAYKLDSLVDLHRGDKPSVHATNLASQMKGPAWRLAATGTHEPTPEERSHATLTQTVPPNLRHPRLPPAWLKHDRHVLRFYAYFQETVNERNDENCRYRHCVLAYFMEDGTLRVEEPKIENSGIPQGAFLKRHRVPLPDGTGFYSPGDFRCGEDVEIYKRVFHITGCDRFTRWFFEENNVDVGPDEPAVVDLWEKQYKTSKAVERGALPATRLVVESKKLVECNLGQPPVDRRLTQFLENDRKVLRFYAYWDDHTLYGNRLYFVCLYYLADNTFEINENHTRNSGRDGFPVFYRRAPLLKENRMNVAPGMLEPDPVPYMPEDFHVGEPFYLYNRTIMIYDCDDFTRSFYKEFIGIDQAECKLDVSEPPIHHTVLPPPPHNGIGTEEDSLINCKMLAPKPPKQDLVRLMTLSGVCLRFEAIMANEQPEDEVRRFVIGFFPDTDSVAVWEVQQRNSGCGGGKFREKARLKNPETGRYFELHQMAVGRTVTISAQPLHIIRADEHTLRFMESRPNEFPFADPVATAKKLEPLARDRQMHNSEGVEPDQLKEMAADVGIELIDHEVITLLRNFCCGPSDGGCPMISGPKILEALQATSMRH
jgi:hypothetical protein